ncbi:protein FAM53A isoform X1 [Saccopteryx leptura]|uniref:protein FAM53A isoform X1 n=1 Tax=Saccopteryx leptura TaxID=249018 RepID=UPI00339CDE31
MVTLITEKLQNQRLDDLVHKSYDAGPYSAKKLDNRSGHLFPFETSADRCPWKAVSEGRPFRSQAATGPALPFPLGPCSVRAGLGTASAVDLRESSGPPSAPPSKRHCRSLSEPDELARCRSPWRPGGSRVWTAVCKRRCHSGGSTSLLGGAPPAACPSSPPEPRPASASSGFVDGRGGGPGPPWCPVGPCTLSSRRRLSLSQERLVDADTPSTPVLGWRLGLLRSRSQPCVLVGRKSRRKRRREEDARWPRPSLDFLKMTRTLKNSKSLGSLDYEGEDDDDARVTAVSSPRDPHSCTGCVTPGPSAPGVCPRPRPCSPGPWASREPVAGEDGSGGDPSDWDSAGEDGCPPDRGELDLEQIERN